jgi:hypothetical protein
MSKMYSITGFNYLELSEKAKMNVDYWLDEVPLEYDDDEGQVKIEFISDWDDTDIDEHCQINGYIFDKRGNPIHNLIEE